MHEKTELVSKKQKIETVDAIRGFYIFVFLIFYLICGGLFRTMGLL